MTVSPRPAPDRTVTEKDLDTLSRQLGRPVPDVVEIGARCVCGNPLVATTAPRLSNGIPFPTTFYLTHPVLTAAVSRVEADGEMARMNDRLAQDPALAAAHRAAHEAYIAERDRVAAGLRAAGWTVPEAQGNFFWFELGERTTEFAAAADGLGIGLDRLTFRMGSSDLPNAGIAGGSAHTATAGGAIHAAGGAPLKTRVGCACALGAKAASASAASAPRTIRLSVMSGTCRRRGGGARACALLLDRERCRAPGATQRIGLNESPRTNRRLRRPVEVVPCTTFT